MFPDDEAWNKGQLQAEKQDWDRSDQEFFRSGACHILAHEFLETYPGAGFRAFSIEPCHGLPGYHIFVARDNTAFVYRGFSSRTDLLEKVILNHRKSDSSWNYLIEELPLPVLRPEFVRDHPLGRRFFGDVHQRARTYIATFPRPEDVIRHNWPST